MNNRCSKCKRIKSGSEFHKNKATKNGFSSWCKTCKKKARKANPEATEKHRVYCKKWNRKYPEKHRAHNKRSATKHPETAKKWSKKHPDKIRLYQKRSVQKARSTARGHLNHRMSYMIWNALRGRKKGCRWESWVGYTVQDLKAHLESKFTEGMSWDIFVQGKIHLDHVIAKSRFHYKSPSDPEFKICWGLSNLQPLWAEDNLKKNAKTAKEWNEVKPRRRNDIKTCV